MKIVIIKYNAGNVQSVQYALKRLGFSAIVSDNESVLRNADRVIFPGVGHAGTAMKYLQEKNLDELIIGLTQPVLGVCVGMQLMCARSEEGNTSCLGIIDTEVVKFSAAATIKVPQMGWNNIYDFKSDILAGVPQNAFVYYVHSYYARLCQSTVATTNYVQPYSAIVQKNNFTGVQFHTEKSAAVGDKILLNFINQQK
ncbi:MAG: imidazole glycerol phosphate synthase subunit HisH [Chitinophagaceae bacterium]|nr:MAG: imidazole glycerol phosphate synthase subunit HisH [Chitinophagaceae bacterium]